MIASAEIRGEKPLSWQPGGQEKRRLSKQLSKPHLQDSKAPQPAHHGLFWNKDAHAAPSAELLSNMLSGAVLGWLRFSTAAGLCRGCSVCIHGSNARYKSLAETSTAQLPQHAEWPPLINKLAQPPAGRVALSLPRPKPAGVNYDPGKPGFSSLKRLCTQISSLGAVLGAAAAQLRGLQRGGCIFRSTPSTSI